MMLAVIGKRQRAPCYQDISLLPASHPKAEGLKSVKYSLFDVQILNRRSGSEYPLISLHRLARCCFFGVPGVPYRFCSFYLYILVAWAWHFGAFYGLRLGNRRRQTGVRDVRYE